MTVTVERTRDYGLIKYLITAPGVYNHITDDGSPRLEDFEPPQSELVYYLLMRNETIPYGLCFFLPTNSATLDAHIVVLPESRGALALAGAKACFKWIWENTQFVRIEARIPEYNRPATHIACLAGMERMGISRQSLMKSGVLHDQVLLGISKGVS